MAGALLTAARAEAFCRTTTVTPPADFVPSGPNGCWKEGKPLYIPSQCIPYQLLARESPIVPNAVLSEHLARAFQSWTSSTECAGSIVPIELGAVNDESIVSFTQGGVNRNVIGVAPEWRYSSGEQLSQTTLTFSAATGAVLDIDLEINGTVKWSLTDPPAPDALSLQSALVHEIGHMWGLSHTSDPDTIMFATTAPGQTRAIEPDDQAGFCAIYPNRGQRLDEARLIAATPCELAPGNPDGTCGDPNIIRGCSSATRGEEGLFSSAIGSLLLALGVIGIRRRIAQS